MKRVHSPFHGRPVVVGGRHRPKVPFASLTRNGRLGVRLGDYLKLSDLPTPPVTCDYTAQAATPLANVYDNDSLGDCVIAGYYHVKGIATGNAGAPFVATDTQIIADYGAIGGYNPGDPTTDNGCDEITALDYWQANGDQGGTKIAGYALLDPTNLVELQVALWLFENHYYGVELPDDWISPFPSGPGFTWDVAGVANPSNGHCFIGGGYDGIGVKIDTWGLLGKFTWAALAKYCADACGGAVYSILTPDALAKGQTMAPNGVDWASLQKDLALLAGMSPAPSASP